jgi:hypothetical protein
LTLEVEAGLADAGEAEAGVDGVRSGLKPCCAEGHNERQYMFWGGVRQVGKRGLAAVVDNIIVPVQTKQVSFEKLHISCVKRTLDQTKAVAERNPELLQPGCKSPLYHHSFTVSSQH